MKRYFTLVCIFFAVLSFELSAQRGLVTCYRQNEGDCLLVSLFHLQENLKTELSIEIWFDEKEMTEEHFEAYSKMKNLVFRRVNESSELELLSILKKTHFSEIIWFDPSTIFVTRPESVFEDLSYQETGAYFFKQLQPLSRMERKVHIKQRQALLNEIVTLLDTDIDRLHYYLKSKILNRAAFFLSRYNLVFTDPRLLYVNLERHQKGLKKALQISEQVNFSSLNATDCLWLGIITSGGNFTINFVKQVELEGIRKLEEPRVAALVHLYRGRALTLENFTPREEESYALVEPASRVSRPLIGYEVELIPELADLYLFFVSKVL